jgi:DNA-binding NarL/FixJ family response regulator
LILIRAGILNNPTFGYSETFISTPKGIEINGMNYAFRHISFDFPFGQVTLAPASLPAMMKILIIDDHALFRRGLELLLSDLDPDIVAFHADRIEQLDPSLHGDVDLVLLDMQLPGGLAGLSALARVRQLLPEVPVVVVSGSTDPGLIRNCIELGAGGFIPKAETPEVMFGALRLVMAGSVYLPSLVLDEIGGRFWAGAGARASGSPEAGHPNDPGRAFDSRGGGSQGPGAGPGAGALPDRWGTDPGGWPPPGGDGAARADDAARGVEEIREVLSPRQLEALMQAVKGKSNKTIARDMDIAEGTVKLHLSAAYRALGVANRTQAVYVVAKLGLRQPQP